MAPLLSATVEDIVHALKSVDRRPLADFVQEALANRKIDILVDALLISFKDDESFEVDRTTQYNLSTAFGTLGMVLSERIASSLLSFLEQETAGSRRVLKIALLLRTLIQSITLHKCPKVCEVVKARAEALHRHLSKLNGDSDAVSLTLAIFAESVASVLLVEAVYDPTTDKSALIALWSGLCPPRKGLGRVLHICTSIQVRAALRESTSELLSELLSDSGLTTVGSANSNLLAHFDPTVEVWKCVIANFPTLVALSSSEEADRLAELVWTALFQAASNDSSLVLPLLTSFVSSPCVWELHKIRRHFIRRLLTMLQMTIEEKDGAKKGIWLEKLSDMIADQPPSFDDSTRKPALLWGKVMGKFFDHHEPIQTRLTWTSTDTFRSVVNLIGSLPVRYLPLELKTTVLGASMMLSAFVVIGHDYTTLQSLLKIVADLLNPDTVNARMYLSRLRLKMDWWLKKLMESASQLTDSSSLAAIVGHSLAAVDSMDTFVERLELVLVAADAFKSPRWHFQVAAAVLQSCQELQQFDEQQVTSAVVVAIERVAQFLRPKFEAVTWRNAKKSAPSEIGTLTAAFLPFRLLNKLSRRVKTETIVCSEFNANMIRLAKKIVVRNANEFGVQAVRESVDFLLLAHNLGFERLLASMRFILPLALISDELVEQVVSESDPLTAGELVSEALEAMEDGDVSTTTLCTSISVLTHLASSSNEQKRDAVKASLGPICAAEARNIAPIVSSSETAIAALQLSSAVLQMVGKTGGDAHAIVGFSLSLLSTVAIEPLPDKNVDRRLMRAVHAVLNDSLKFCPTVVASNMTATYASSVHNFIGAVIARCPIGGDVLLDAQLEACQMVSRLCTLIAGHKKEFGKIAPYVVAQYVTKSLERGVHPSAKVILVAGMHRLLHICDKYGVAMLSTNLPPGPKDIFAHMFREYKKFAVLAV